MTGEREVVVIGGGFAGMSAGVGLAERGFRVAVLEQKPSLGGRAYSFTDPDSGDFVDNGQHVLMGCYTETLDFLHKIGTYGNLVFRRDLDIEMIAAGGSRARLKTPKLPGPLHMAGAVLGYKHLTRSEQLSLLAAGFRVLTMHRFSRPSLETATVAGLMDLLKQSTRVRERFWYPLAIATLNDDPSLASSALLAEVLKRAFFSRRNDSAFVYSSVGLTDLYCAAAERFIVKRGGIVASRSGVEELELGNDRTVARVRLRGGQKLAAANFVAAVPFTSLLRILPAPAAANPFFSRLGRLATSPIICVHVWLDREVIDSAFAGFIGTTTQWLFNKRRIFSDKGLRHPGYLSFVISGARSLMDCSNQELLDQVMRDLRSMVPAARDATLIKALVLKEKNATMSPGLESHELRPGTSTPLQNFFLAGDWIQTGLPATIESAVISGRMAAEAVTMAVEKRLRPESTRP